MGEGQADERFHTRIPFTNFNRGYDRSLCTKHNFHLWSIIAFYFQLAL